MKIRFPLRDQQRLLSDVRRGKWMKVNTLGVCVCVYLQPQIYEDSIVIKSVFESARQRIVTNEQQKETVSTSHSDNGGEAEDQFAPSAGERQWTKARRKKTERRRQILQGCL